MKKRFTLLACIIGLFTIANAQIPNSGFENWYTSASGYDPVDWVTSNASPWVSVTQATPAYAGNYSLSVAVWQIMGANVSGVCQSNGFYFSSRPYALNGWVKCTVMPGDSVSVVVTATSGGVDSVAIGAARRIYTSDITSFTYFTLPIYYPTADPSDTVYIDVTAGRMGTPIYGTEIIVDELSLTPALGIGENDPYSNVVGQNYPNPATDVTFIPLNLKSADNISAKVFDMTGREVENLLNTSMLSGSQQIELSVIDLPNGVYYYTLQGNNFTATRKFIVSK
jgi:hypothetical protein